MQLGEFFIALGFDVDDQKLKEFNQNLKDGWKDMLKLSAVAAGTVYAINKFVSGGIEAATALRNFNLETGHSIDNLQKWQAASVLTNAAMSAEQVTASITRMTNAMASVREGTGPSGAFARLGIGMEFMDRDVSDVLEELRKNFDTNVARWGYQNTVNLMEEVGFDKGMLGAMKLSTDQWNKFTSNVLSAESQEKLVALGDAISKFKWEFKLWKDELSADIAPALIEWLDKAIPAFKAFAEAFGAVFKALSELSASDKAALATFATVIFATFNPIKTLFVLLAAAIYDVGKFLQGLDSYTGSGIEKLKELAEFFGFENKKSTFDFENIALPDFLKNNNERPFAGTDFDKIYARNLNPASERDREIARMAYNNSVNMNNVMNIHSTADAATLSDMIAMRNKQMLEAAQAELGNGAVR